jgi:glycosyltransferase involved in cell wall biosynthesis
MQQKIKILRVTTVPMALKYLLPGQMQFMQQNGFAVTMVSANGPELQQVIANEACPHIVVPLTRQITPLQDVKCLYQLYKVIKKLRPQIVHSHTPKAGLIAMLAAKLARVPIRIHTVAGLPLMVHTGFKYQLLKQIEKLTFWAANNVWPNSHSLLNSINTLKLTQPNKLKVLANGSSNGIQTAQFSKQNLNANLLQQIKTSINYQPNNTYFLCVGRLVADKGIAELINAFTQIQKTHLRAKLILVGSFEAHLDPLPAATLHQIQYNKDIKHVGWSDNVAYYMAIANYFVFASHREGFPNVLLQAAAMQLPIICSNIPGNIDVVSHNQTGLIFEKGNTTELQQNMLWALQNQPQMQLMATNAYNFVTQNFERTVVWQAIRKQYNQLLKNKNIVNTNLGGATAAHY